MNFRLLFSTSSTLICTGALLAQAPNSGDANNPVTLDRIDVSAGHTGLAVDRTPYLPVTASISATRIEETINIVDTEDAVKYLPSLFLRKRNYGDTQAVMATRTWGVSSSARSLVFADGVPLTALTANNNNIGAPRWGLIAPPEIDHIDVMYGPFSAAYAGNSIGAVMEIYTRLPEKLEASIIQTEALQNFNLYGTNDDFLTHQTAALVGNRMGKFFFWVSGNFQDSHSQPLTYVTASAFPTGTTGGYAANNKLGAPANVLGAAGLLHTQMANAHFKLAYDFTPWLRAAYTFGLWRNDADSATQTFLTNAAGLPTYAGQSGFASGTYHLFEQHSAHSLVFRTDTKGNWDFELVGSRYHYDQDKQSTPTTASATNATALSFGSAGRVAVLDGTGWTTVDFKGTWRPEGKSGAHTVTFGAHDDQYTLLNPTYNTSNWAVGGPYTSVATEGDGKTRTQALWVQDAWQLVPAVKFTAGLRYEEWRAFDGYNANGTTVVHQPTVNTANLSPKARLVWTTAPAWTVTASLAQAYRYATAAELYQLVSTGSTFTSPSPDLKPDNDVSAELAVEHTFQQGRVRVSLFQDDVHDAIISQFLPLVPGSSTLYSYLANVDHVRARGVELYAERRDVFIRGLEFSGSVTYLNARTLALSGAASATAPAGSAVGKFLPNIPEWRAGFLATYRPNERWALSAGGRYSSKMFTTLDNSDVNFNTYQGFAAWFVADVHVNCRIDRNWSTSVGLDNVLNRKYFLFHPFPQRTVVGTLKYAF